MSGRILDQELGEFAGVDGGGRGEEEAGLLERGGNEIWICAEEGLVGMTGKLWGDGG